MGPGSLLSLEVAVSEASLVGGGEESALGSGGTAWAESSLWLGLLGMAPLEVLPRLSALGPSPKGKTCVFVAEVEAVRAEVGIGGALELSLRDPHGRRLARRKVKLVRDPAAPAGLLASSAGRLSLPLNALSSQHPSDTPHVQLKLQYRLSVMQSAEGGAASEGSAAALSNSATTQTGRDDQVPRGSRTEASPLVSSYTQTQPLETQPTTASTPGSPSTHESFKFNAYSSDSSHSSTGSKRSSKSSKQTNSSRRQVADASTDVPEIGEAVHIGDDAKDGKASQVGEEEAGRKLTDEDIVLLFQLLMERKSGGRGSSADGRAEAEPRRTRRRVRSSERRTAPPQVLIPRRVQERHRARLHPSSTLFTSPLSYNVFAHLASRPLPARSNKASDLRAAFTPLLRSGQNIRLISPPRRPGPRSHSRPAGKADAATSWEPQLVEPARRELGVQFPPSALAEHQRYGSAQTELGWERAFAAAASHAHSQEGFFATHRRLSRHHSQHSLLQPSQPQALSPSQPPAHHFSSAQDQLLSTSVRLPSDLNSPRQRRASISLLSSANLRPTSTEAPANSPLGPQALPRVPVVPVEGPSPVAPQSRGALRAGSRQSSVSSPPKAPLSPAIAEESGSGSAYASSFASPSSSPQRSRPSPRLSLAQGGGAAVTSPAETSSASSVSSGSAVAAASSSASSTASLPSETRRDGALSPVSAYLHRARQQRAPNAGPQPSDSHQRASSVHTDSISSYAPTE